MWDEALKICGQDPGESQKRVFPTIAPFISHACADFHRKDLQEAIESGAHAKWQFAIQVIPEAKEHDFDFDILDATKVWPE